jgi:signal transduction histidine kinase
MRLENDMLAKIMSWFQAPVFPEDEDGTRRALLLNAVVNTFLISLPMLFAGIILGDSVPRFERVLVIIACAWLTNVGASFMMRTGRVAAAGVVTVTTIFIATTLAIYTLGTIRAPATSFYILATVTAGLTINRRAITWTAGLSIVTVLLLLFGEMNGFMPPPTLSVNITQGITITVLFTHIAVLLYLAVKNIDEGLARVRQELVERAYARERELNRREMMEKVIRLGKTVTEQTSNFHDALLRIWDGVHNGLDFDRTAIFLYDSNDRMMQGSYGTNRQGEMSNEWDMRFGLNENAFFKIVLSRPDGFYFTSDYAGERNLHLRPGHLMEGVRYYAAVACWSGDKPVGIICVDQLISGRVIAEEQLEALRLFAGYAGLAIENTRLNAELEKRIEELANRNAELERFTYTVSHDLRSPIITVKGFVGMLNKDIREGRKDRIRNDMQRISNAADKMDALLSDLLELSRIGRLINPPEEIDLVELTYETLETVDGRLRAKNITTHVSPGLPTIYADRVRMSEVLENLLDNAAKYMGDQPNPLIEIGSRIDNNEQVIYVKDNGMGIEPQYQEKIFGLFEKLDSTSDGTGIGLALIKRIIEVHGGKIWVESDGPGKGSTFCFTIPGK